MCGSGKLGVHAFHKRFGTTVTVLSDIALQVFTKGRRKRLPLCSSWYPEASCPGIVIKTGAACSQERRASAGIIYSFKYLYRHASHHLTMLLHTGATSSEFLCSFSPTRFAASTPTPSSFHLLPLLTVLPSFSQPRPNLTSSSLPLLDH